MSSEAGKGITATREISIAATPEQVWEAIATSAGNAGWLFPAEIEERVGGTMVMHRQPFGGDATAKITAYDPPRRFALVEDTGPDMPPWAYELLIEGRAGGTTIVRVVIGFDEGGEGWEEMVEGAAEGWAGALQILRVYVEQFLGRPTVTLGVTGDTGRPLGDRAELSEELLGSLGLIGLRSGEKFRGPDDAPPLAGIVEGGEFDDATVVTAEGHGCLIRTDEPAPGIFEVSTFSMNGQTVTVNVVGRLYGDDVAQLVTRDEPRWVDWLRKHFPDVEAVTVSQ
jgi:uncharacterized protein YndB with AHSA1/START domain